MTKQIELQGNIFTATHYSEEIELQEETKEYLIKVKFRLNLVGDEAQRAVYQLIKSPFTFILENGMGITVKTKSHSYAYKGDDIEDETPIIYKLEFIQIPQPQVIEESTVDPNGTYTRKCELQFKALYALLIDRGIITEEEYIMKLQDIQE